MNSETNKVSIEYRLHFDRGESVSHVVQVSIQGSRPGQGGDLPDWTKIENHQCSNCPYRNGEVSHCPAAVKLAPLVEELSDHPSDTEINLEVVTAERTVRTHATLQRAMSSLFGAAIASSQCPHTSFLLPMARFHLPLSTESETVYRVASMFLLGQHLRRRQGEEVEDGLTELTERYKQLAHVNRGLAARLRSSGKEDVSVNAVILLDLLARIVPTNIEDELEDLCRWYGVPVRVGQQNVGEVGTELEAQTVER